MTNQYIVEKKLHSISSKSQKIIDRQNKLYGIYSVVVKRQDKKEKGFHYGKMELYIVFFFQFDILYVFNALNVGKDDSIQYNTNFVKSKFVGFGN